MKPNPPTPAPSLRFHATQLIDPFLSPPYLFISLLSVRGLRRFKVSKCVFMSVEQGALMSETFFPPSCPPRWEDLRALSHAAVKDSCHPVSGSNTHTRQRVKGFEATGRARTPGKNAQVSKTRRRGTGCKRTKRRRRNLMSKEFGYTLWRKRRRGEREKHRTNTKAIFIRAWRGKSGHLPPEMKTKKGRWAAFLSDSVETRGEKAETRAQKGQMEPFPLMETTQSIVSFPDVTGGFFSCHVLARCQIMPSPFVERSLNHWMRSFSF